MVGCFLWEVGRRENRTITNNKHNHQRIHTSLWYNVSMRETKRTVLAWL